MKKKIMIFGGGLNQLTLIQAARELNVISIVIDPDPNALGKELADFFEVVGPNDFEKTLEIAEKYQVDGIVTSQMENPLIMMARIAQKLNLIFPSIDVIERSRNKYLMKKSFIKNGVPCAKGILIKENNKIKKEKVFELDLPLIIKPLDAFSSRGVYRLEHYSEIDDYINESMSYSSNGTVIVEEFLEGREYSVESLTYKGVTIIIQITEKIITSYPNTVELGHIQPADLMSDEKNKIENVVKKGIFALGIDNTASHSEVIFTKEGPKIIEIGARLGGDFIASYLTFASTGIDMDKAAIQISLGEKPLIKFKIRKYAYIKYLEMDVGRKIKEIKKYDDLCKNNEDLLFAHIFANEGDIINKITNSAERIGVIIVKANSREELLANAVKFEKQLKERIILE